MGDNYGEPTGVRSRQREGVEQIRTYLSTFPSGGTHKVERILDPGRILDADGPRLGQIVIATMAALVVLLGVAVSSPGLFLNTAPTGPFDIAAFLPWVALAAAQLMIVAASYRSAAVRRRLDRLALAFCYLTAGCVIIQSGGGASDMNEAIMLLFAIPAIGVGYGIVSRRPLWLSIYFAVSIGGLILTAVVSGEALMPLFTIALIGLSTLVTLVISGLVAARSRYRTYEEQYRSVSEQAFDGVYLFDADKEALIDANPAFCRMTGMTVPQLQRSRLDDVLLPIVSEDSDAPSRRRNALGYIENRVLRRADGRLVPVELRADWIAHRGKNVLSVVVYDIQAREEYEERLMRARESAQDIANFKSALLANMSHEIRTPLCSILGWAAVLTDELPDRQRELVGLIEKSGQRLNATLDSVIELAHLHANAKTIRPILLDLNEVVASTVDNVSSLAESKGLQLQVNRMEDEIWAELDPSCLRRIIVHIVDNAIKFTNHGSVTVTIGRRGEEASVAIEDTGEGISNEFLPMIFDEFKQGSEGLARDHEGNGLGLAITRRLVELIGGRIDVVSERGVGSTFTVFVPAIRAPAVAETRYRDRRMAQTG